MDPAEAVTLAEVALREAVRSVLPDWTRAKGAPKLEELQRKRDEDAKRRNGTVVSDDLLAYAELHHLTELIRRNWERFSPLFDDLQRTKTFFGLLLDYRNPVAHNRELVAFERDLLAGASGQLRNQVVLYRSRHEPSSAHYPVIESVTDGFGRKLTAEGGGLRPVFPGGDLIRLDVGERVQFTCSAWDSQDRELTWRFRASRREPRWAWPSIELTGRRVTFSVRVGEEWVGESVGVGISVASPGPHHRHREDVYGDGVEMEYSRYDDEVYGYYAVNPPRG